MNSALSLNLEAALVAYLTPLCPFAESVTGASDRRHADEDQYGILGQYVAVPAVTVSVPGGSNTMNTVPVIETEVMVTVRHSAERSTPATHKADSVTVSDALWTVADLNTAIGDTDGITLSQIYSTGETFTREGRKLETTFTFNAIISSKEIEP